MKGKNLFYLILIFSIISLSVFGKDTEQKKDWGMVPMAAPYYTPDTSGGLGFYVVTYFLNNGKEVSKPDEISIYGTYTLKNQVSVGIQPEMYFSNGEYKLSAMLEASRYPTVFWGTGADTPDSNEEEYTPRALWTSTGFMVRILPDFYAGPLLRLQHIRVEKTEEGGLMDRGAVRGSDGTDIVGTGVTIQIDKRDSVFYPKKGYYLSLKGAVNRSEIGSEYDFLWSMTDFRKFIGIHGDHVLAFQTIAELSWGDVPIQSMGGLGGNMMMRGMLQNRYLDKCSLEAQAEYRFPIYWRFGGVAFAGAGEVQPALTDFNLKDIHTTWGGGLRFIVDREQHISLRLDMGVDDQGNVNAYFLVKEAF